MQDRFNFRFWHKLDKKMQDWKGSLFWQALNNNNLIPQQCTGLKDKNGKLIYEGDILEICESFKRTLYRVKGEIVYETAKGFIYQGSYTTNGHTVRFVKRRLIDLYDDEMNCFDGFICGNIYENPELLEE